MFNDKMDSQLKQHFCSCRCYRSHCIICWAFCFNIVCWSSRSCTSHCITCGFFVSLVCVGFSIWSGVGSAVCEEVVGSAVGAVDVESEVGCSVEVKVFGSADGLNHLLGFYFRQCVC